MLDFKLFKDKLFAHACAANAFNGLARGAVLFVLIFFFQGPYGQDPLRAARHEDSYMAIETIKC